MIIKRSFIRYKLSGNESQILSAADDAYSTQNLLTKLGSYHVPSSYLERTNKQLQIRSYLEMLKRDNLLQRTVSKVLKLSTVFFFCSKVFLSKDIEVQTISLLQLPLSLYDVEFRALIYYVRGLIGA